MLHIYFFIPLFIYKFIFTCMYRFFIVCPLDITTKHSNGKKKNNKFASPSGNRTPVFRVTGGDTVHYTNEEWLKKLDDDTAQICVSVTPAQDKITVLFNFLYTIYIPTSSMTKIVCLCLNSNMKPHQNKWASRAKTSLNFPHSFSMVVLITTDVIYFWPQAGNGGRCFPILGKSKKTWFSCIHNIKVQVSLMFCSHFSHPVSKLFKHDEKTFLFFIFYCIFKQNHMIMYVKV